ncbi:nitroreductase family protein [Rhodococcus sp. T2V]|uniref:nitroreductase family protein n=1 Tax=Rhodococcus sp. T2V TaxID=3034164 RepID=UPI0023E16593|nr:nitroreductase family protein [Rhodococcus sp. T2V]MDF3311893.1 nitroreductase family protein [Rhodococcus sp. T2V]
MVPQSQDVDRLNLSSDELLSTTRSVRKRLDFDRPVPREALVDCVRLALQAPSGSNRWVLQFVVVTDEAQRKALADVYRRGFETYRTIPSYIGNVDKGSDERNANQQRTAGSAEYLAENMERAPALVVACGMGKAESGPPIAKTTLLGSVLPGMWSFMLAARERGLGTSWTTVMLFHEQEAADVLGIPNDEVTIGALTPVAYTKGTSFKPAMRPDPEEVIHWDRW